MNEEKMYNMLLAGKFKGKTRIILQDQRTGHRDVFENKNMVTNALPRIFESDYQGAMDFYNLMPLRKLMGGIFLFWSSLTESAENFFPPNQSIKLSFYAGDVAHSTANPYRGNPNGTATVLDPTNGQIKYVWDWALEGTGEISAAALTYGDFGNIGLLPDGSAPLVKSLGVEVDNVTSYLESVYGNDFSEAKAVRYPVFLKDNGIGVAVWVSGSTFTEKLVRHPWVMPTLCEGAAIGTNDNYTVISTRSATLSRSFTSSYFMISQDSDNYYVMERDSQTATKLYVDVVSKTDMSVTSQVIDITESMARPSMSGAMIFNGIVSDGYIYWPSSANTKTFVRIDMATPANTDLLTSSLTDDVKLYAMPIVLSDGLIIGRNWLINGDYLYPVQERRSYGASWETWDETLPRYKNSPLVYMMPLSHYSSGSRRINSGGLLVPYLATINNLEDAPIRKNNNQTMRAEYTITFTESV